MACSPETGSLLDRASMPALRSSTALCAAWKKPRSAAMWDSRQPSKPSSFWGNCDMEQAQGFSEKIYDDG